MRKEANAEPDPPLKVLQRYDGQLWSELGARQVPGNISGSSADDIWIAAIARRGTTAER